jgi:hypothetical protein
MECISDARAAAISNSPPPWTDQKPLMEEANSREMGPESSYNESKFPRNLDTSTFLAQRQNKNLFPIGFTLEDFFLDEKLFTTRNSEIWLCNYRFSSKLLVLKVRSPTSCLDTSPSNISASWAELCRGSCNHPWWSRR